MRALLAAACVTACCPLVLSLRFHALQHVAVRRTNEEWAVIPKAPVVRAMALGHREWAADLYWITGLVYFGEGSASHSSLRYIEDYARLIEDVSPDFRRAYLWGATVNIYSHKLITAASVQRSIGHLSRGLTQFPGDGELLYQLGFNYWFELPPHLADEAERRAARARGAEYLRQAATLGFGPQWLVLAAASTLDETGQNSSAVELLSAALLRTDDPTMRDRISRRIQLLSPQGVSDPSIAFSQRIEQARRRAMPYVPPSVYLFVGPVE